MIKKKHKERSIYVSKILSVLKPHTRILDIGCGTAHLIHELATTNVLSYFIKLDISPVMLNIAYDVTVDLSNIGLVEGEGERLPFNSYIFYIVITK